MNFHFEYGGKIYSRYKKWDFARIERVLTRLKSPYWEIEIRESVTVNNQ